MPKPSLCDEITATKSVTKTCNEIIASRSVCSQSVCRGQLTWLVKRRDIHFAKRLFDVIKFLKYKLTFIFQILNLFTRYTGITITSTKRARIFASHLLNHPFQFHLVIILNLMFYYTWSITPKYVTSWLDPFLRHCACTLHSSFRNVATVASGWQHCAQFDQPKT